MATQQAPDITIDQFENGIGAFQESSILAESDRYDEALDTDPEFYAGKLARTELEERADVEPIEKLHHRRRLILRELAPLAALYEGGQVPLVDARRKQHRALVSRDIAAEARTKGEKEPSEAALERMANANTRHVVFVQLLEQKRIQYIRLKNQLTQIQERIRDRELSLLSYQAEARLSR